MISNPSHSGSKHQSIPGSAKQSCVHARHISVIRCLISSGLPVNTMEARLALLTFSVEADPADVPRPDLRCE